MNLFENVRLAVAGLVSNKMRALLTMLGIIIGIGSVIAITSVGEAMTGVVSSEMESMGVNNVAFQVYPRDPSGSTMYTDDDLITNEMIDAFTAKFADRIQGIALEEGIGNGTITTRTHTEEKVSIRGVNEGFATGATGQQVNLLKGRFITDNDARRGSRIAVISEKLAPILFGAQNPIGQEVKVDTTFGRKTFTVVGVYEDKTSSFMMSMGGGGSSTSMYIPLNTAYNIEDYHPKGVFYFYVSATSGIDYQAFAKEGEDFFNQKFYARNKELMIMSQSLDSMVDQAKSMMGSLSMAISVIAAISLLVGGIGVMNIMLVSVTERTREIGIRKALGAMDSAIRLQFIVESMIICFIGGIFGILVGAGLGYLGGMLLQTPAAPSIQSIAIAVSFSMLIGVFFGYYPANKAAKLDPIEALRYE